MTQVFYVENTGRKQYEYVWMCSVCRKVVAIKDFGSGTDSTFPAVPDSVLEPIHCESCGNLSDGAHRRSVPIWIRPDTGEELIHLKNYPGACYNDEKGCYDYKTKSYRLGPDDRCLIVICPNGMPWSIDSIASNCTAPDDILHRCWIRSGSPEAGDLHVDKNGHTCSAGQGSIQMGDYHGFISHGKFKDNR